MQARLWGLALSSVLALSLTGAAWAANAQPLRVAVWDPGANANSSRFRLNAAFLNQVARWLADADVSVVRLTTAQVADPAEFNADKFDVLAIEGNAIPAANIAAYQNFTKAGGILLALSADCPFEIKIAQDAQKVWRLSPETPNFAWQTTAIHELLGMKFNWQLDMEYSGVKHTVTPLLAGYVPQAQGHVITKPLPNRWFVPTTGTFYPLIRSQQLADGDYTPQIYLVVNGSNRAIICASRIFTGELNPKLWPWSKETVVALAKLAGDWRAGKLKLDSALSVAPSKELRLPEALEVRSGDPGIDPEHAQPIVRWGAFNGSRLELGKNLAAGKTLQLPAAVKAADVPGALEPGARVELALPDLGSQPAFLRIRGAFAATGAGLCAKLGDTTVLNELFTYRVSTGEVNVTIKYQAVPIEFTRILALPPDTLGARTLQLSNPGTQPIYFDAIQIERRSTPARVMGLGLGNGVNLAYDRATKLTPEICKDWSYFRCTSRTFWIGAPDDPKRWERYDKHVERFLALSPRTQLILEGTPEWAALSAQRYKEGGQRPHMSPPDNAKYKELVERIVAKYAGRVEGWELWNETNIRQFWQGSPQEYAAFFNTMAPVIRKLDPKATLVLGGMAGTTSSTVDPFAAEMVAAGCTKQADLFAFHPYARNGAWDLPFGLIEGHLMNLGSDIELYCNESGYSLTPDFSGSGGSVQWQADNINIAVARLLANGLAKLTIFNAGGDGDSYGLFDKEGKPRPAYRVFADYLELAQNQGRRLDVILLAGEDRPLQGVYRAAATHADGTVTLVVNPADVEALAPADDPSQDFNAKNNPGWVTFFGKSEFQANQVVITPGEKGVAGFYRKVRLDPRQYPKIEVNVPQCAKQWTLTLKFADGQNVELVKEGKAGTFTFAYADQLKNLDRQECEISFRILGGPAAIASVRFPAALEVKPTPVPVRLLAPLPRAGAYTASARVDAHTQPVSLKLLSVQGQNWAQVDMALTGRAVVTLKP